MKNIKAQLGVLAVVLLTSCSPKIPFTQAVREKYKLTNQELSKLQFYISDEVTLKNGTPTEVDKAVEDGKLIIKTSKSDELVVIKSKTPGTVDETVDLTTVKVAFEDGMNKGIVFMSKGDKNGYYRLAAIQDGGRYKISYNNQEYYLYSGGGAVLLFKKKSLKDIQQTEKVAKGKRVN
ncbi:MAG: hypothetical protein RL516_260 [Bacteroidota bacterium]|jgi:hypothetical protein